MLPGNTDFITDPFNIAFLGLFHGLLQGLTPGKFDGHGMGLRQVDKARAHAMAAGHCSACHSGENSANG